MNAASKATDSQPPQRPHAGQQADEILAELGLDAAAVSARRESGAVA